MKTKVVYIAHPISDDIAGNIAKIYALVRLISFKRPDVIPFVPYLVYLGALDDHEPNERAMGMRFNEHFISPKYIDELWVMGLSEGVFEEIEQANQQLIKIIYWCKQMDYNEFKKTGYKPAKIFGL